MRCKGKSLFINQKKIPYNLWHNAITKKRRTNTHGELRKESLNLSLRRWRVLWISLKLEVCFLGLRDVSLIVRASSEGLALVGSWVPSSTTAPFDTSPSGGGTWVAKGCSVKGTVIKSSQISSDKRYSSPSSARSLRGLRPGPWLSPMTLWRNPCRLRQLPRPSESPYLIPHAYTTCSLRPQRLPYPLELHPSFFAAPS